MKHLLKHFRRDAFGMWTCTEPVELTLPQGRLQITKGSRFARGTKFADMDLAAILDTEYRRLQNE